MSHAAPLVPNALYDFEIGIGDYRPTRGSHISALDSFWDGMRPLAYGAAGNYAIPRAIESLSPPTALTGVFSHRKIVVRKQIGEAARRYPINHEISISAAMSLPAEEAAPQGDLDFLIAPPVEFPRGLVVQYAESHHALDLFEYLSLAVRIGVMTASDVQEFAQEKYFLTGGCELGIYPTEWLYHVLDNLQLLGRHFLEEHGHRIRSYDGYQVRAVGFLAERLGSYFLLRELRRRYPAGVPLEIFGCLCVIVPEGAEYSHATVAT